MEVDLNEVWMGPPAATMVAEFHQAFNHPIKATPMTPDDFRGPTAELRMMLIKEEFNELVSAFETCDMIGFIDALQDLKYVIYGAELALGISGEEHFSEVHQANMRKLGPDGKPIYREDGKVLKPDGWQGPDHAGVLDLIETSGRIY